MQQALNLQEVTFIAKDFLHNEFGIKRLPVIKMNSRLGRATLGRFMFSLDGSKKVEIEIATNIDSWSFQNKCSLLQGNISTVLHECVHYALFRKELPYDDGQVRFELELKKRGIKSNYTRDELQKKWRRKGSQLESILNEYDNNFIKDFKQYYEDIILQQRQQSQIICANTKQKKRAGCKGAKTVVVIDGVRIEKPSKSEMQRYIRKEYNLPADGYWFMVDELPKKHRSRVSYIEFDGTVIYNQS